jgi:hypothetical protein
VSHPPIINPTHKVNIKIKANLALVSITGLDFTVNRRATSAIKSNESNQRPKPQHRSSGLQVHLENTLSQREV